MVMSSGDREKFHARRWASRMVSSETIPGKSQTMAMGASVAAD